MLTVAIVYREVNLDKMNFLKAKSVPILYKKRTISEFYYSECLNVQKKIPN